MSKITHSTLAEALPEKDTARVIQNPCLKTTVVHDVKYIMFYIKIEFIFPFSL